MLHNSVHKPRAPGIVISPWVFITTYLHKQSQLQSTWRNARLTIKLLKVSEHEPKSKCQYATANQHKRILHFVISLTQNFVCL